MATTTTNFGWDIPQSTDLVKDGATAIAALGQDIDTALVDLKGGTTGQVLSKASGTDLDFTWVAQDDSNAIQNAIVDAKGDLIAATAADTPARLAVGTNGQVLTADSTAATGIKWATPATTSSGLVYVGQGTFSAASSATLDNCFTSTYRNYILVFDYTASGGSDINVTFRTGGTDNTNSSYYSEQLAAYGSNVVAANASSQTSAKVAAGSGNGGLLNATIFAPEATAITRIESRGHKDVGGSAETHVYNAGFNATTSFDGIKISASSGTLTGTFRVYGLANS
jgi:hypothetical protein